MSVEGGEASKVRCYGPGLEPETLKVCCLSWYAGAGLSWCAGGGLSWYVGAGMPELV